MCVCGGKGKQPLLPLTPPPEKLLQLSAAFKQIQRRSAVGCRSRLSSGNTAFTLCCFFFPLQRIITFFFFFLLLGPKRGNFWKKQRVLSACWTVPHLFGIVSSQLQKRGAKTAEFPADVESDWRRRRRREKLKDGNKYIC